ncbi:MAG: FAD:protein FMN transferase [Phyllobacterium sp.]
MTSAINRRRFIGISAAAAGLALLPFGASARAHQGAAVWEGQALGAPAKLIIHHPDRAFAERLVQRVTAEVARLERIFSLYRADSELAELNRTGALAMPSAEFVDLLGRCRDYWAASHGLFDPTVQPLWLAINAHFSAPDADPAGPSAMAMRAALEPVGFDGVRFNRDRIAFARPSMAITLNGIAQGYITDRVVQLLRDNGITQSLVNMGENRAIGTRPDGTPWRIGVADIETEAEPAAVVEIVNRAVATSSVAGFRFDTAGRFNHLLDPAHGTSARLYRRLTVIAPDATGADAWSTAFNLMEAGAIENILRTSAGLDVHLTTIAGQPAVLKA